MRNMVRLALVAALLGASPAIAQMSAEVKFDPGNYGTMVSGSIKGNEYFDYKLGAGGGQKLFVELIVDGTDGNGTIFFNVLPPGSNDVAIYIGSNDTDMSETITLPEDGEYTIRVYLMGNDEDTNKTVSYSLDISIQ